MTDRDTPYTPEEQRVVDWLVARTHNTLGAGDDPIGFVLASYELIHSELQKAQALVAHCEQFIDEQHISCAEAIHQTDHVIENAHAFIEGVCDIVGYHMDPE